MKAAAPVGSDLQRVQDFLHQRMRALKLTLEHVARAGDLDRRREIKERMAEVEEIAGFIARIEDDRL